MNYRKSVVDFINTYEEIEQKQQLTRQEMQVREESRQLATDIMKCTAFIENSCGLVMSEVSNQLIKETLNKCNDMIFEYDKIAIQHNKINSELDQMPILQRYLYCLMKRVLPASDWKTTISLLMPLTR